LEENDRPNWAILASGSAAVMVVSALMLPWPEVVASTVLGALMIAGADVDARTYLLPDLVTWGAVACGVVAAVALDPPEGWYAAGAAIVRSAGTALALALMRECYVRLRAREGLGFGDVKLAAAVGVWLPVDTIPLCFGLATGAALLAVLLTRLRGDMISASTRIPFGAFLCPALWLVFYASVLPA